MIHNKFDLAEGETVILDEEYANSSEVVIVCFTSKQLYATVKDVNGTGDAWTVMTNRLSPKYKYIKELDGSVTGIRMGDIKHESGNYTMILRRKSNWV